jgi:hypothetical protein
MGESFKAGGAVFGFVDLARTKAVEQSTHDASHVCVIVDDEKSQAIEIDPDHTTSGATGAMRPSHRNNRKDLALTRG